MSELVKGVVQAWGSAFSRWFFTERNLASVPIRWFYLKLYGSFKWFFERKEMAVLQALVRPGSTVLDIGANVGWTASHFAKTAGQVLAFEPDPVARSIGEFKTRHLKNLTWFPFALGEREGSVAFFQNLSNRADNRVHLDNDMMPFFKKIEVPVRDLSAIARQNPELFSEVSFVKIDVQGAEGQVFKGMASWLLGLQSKPVIAFEWWPYELSRAGSSPEEFLGMLRNLGYSIPEEISKTINRVNEKDWYSLAIIKPTI
ncbi:MAG: FkbM family methyltransferase [Patescibacteria group bacterium]|jgi:FkbM family methyltransferase